MSDGKNIPQPLDNIGCQELLQEENIHCGWLRKQSFINRIGKFRWPQIYMVLSGGCVYYFKNEYSTRPAGKFTLYGYNSVSRAQEKISPKVAPFAFKVVHAIPENFKTYFFAAGSEKEMKEWMKHIKSQLIKANGDKGDNYYYTYRKADADAKASQDDDKSMTYQEIERDIYADSADFTVTSDYKARFKLKGKDDVSDDEDISVPAPPPSRKPKKDAYKERPPAPIPGDQSNTQTDNSVEDEPPSIPPRLGRETEEYAQANKDKNKERRKVSKEAKTETAFKNELSEVLTNNNEKHHHRGKRGSNEEEQKQTPETVRTKGSHGKSREEARKAAAQTTTDDVDDEEEDAENYWKNIYFDGDDKEKAQEIIRNLGEDGVYLVRRGVDGGQVLVVFADNMPKKYKISYENNEYFLKKEGPHCDSVEMLMYTYYNTDLPTAKVMLSTPYKLHANYTGS